MSHVLIELGAVVLTLGLLARLAHRFGLSPIPLYLLAGLAFGQGGLLPLVQTEDFIEIAAEIGVILLLLMLGLEYSAEELVSSLKTSKPAGVFDFVANFTPGFVAGLILGWEPIEAVVLGGVTYVSSSGVIAKTLGDLGRLGNRETPTILSILVLEDLTMALYLPIVTGLLVGGGITNTITLVAIALFAVVVILLSALRFGGQLSRLIGTPNDEVLLLLVMGMALVVAGISEELHVSAGVGAFLVGIAVSGPVAHGARQLLSPLRDLFAAVFFVFFGLRTDPTEIPDVIVIAILLAIVTSFTKYATGYWAAKRAGIAKRGRVRAGLSLIARGEFSIVIAGLAVSAGKEPRLAAVAAAYVLILAIAGPILSRYNGGKVKKPPASVVESAAKA